MLLSMPISPAMLQDPAHCACAGLRRAARAVTQHYDDALRPVGLRSTQFTLLATLRKTGPVALTALADLAVLDRTTLARNLAVLRRAGLVRVRPGPDARVRMIRLTEAGAARLQRAMPRWRQAQTGMAKGLAPERLERLLGDLAAAVGVAISGAASHVSRRTR
jgi:DNA-binding MarR family transcriptional regulator